MFAAIFFLSFSFKLSAQDGEKLFKQNCAVCHAAHTDQRLTGPGLKGLFDRVPKAPTAEAWLTKWILNNEAVIKSGDTYANKL
ncbi:MAG: c-type cytochrome, partial [Sphingobacteriaceae bacterium]